MAELTSDLGDAMQRINAKARVCEMASMLLYMIVVAALEAFFFGVKDTARVAQALSCAVGGPIAVASWRFLTPRPTQHDLAEGQWLLTAGFVKVKETATLLRLKYPELFTFLCAFAVSEAGTSSIIGLVVVYVSQQLCLAVGPVLVLAVVFTIPGALLSKRFAKGGRAKDALLACLAVFVATIVSVSLFCYSHAHASRVPAFAVLLGLAIGFMRSAGRRKKGGPPSLQHECSFLTQSFQRQDPFFERCSLVEK